MPVAFAVQGVVDGEVGAVVAVEGVSLEVGEEALSDRRVDEEDER